MERAVAPLFERRPQQLEHRMLQHLSCDLSCVALERELAFRQTVHFASFYNKNLAVDSYIAS